LARVLEALKKLNREDLRVLNVIELGMTRHLFVPFDEIVKATGFDAERVEIITRKLNMLGLIQRNIEGYVGYILTSRGYDCLALNVLKKRGLIEKIGASPIGVGKESDVYPAITSGGKLVVLKFHRVGRISFRKTRRTRVYIGDRRHISWLYQSRLAARNEYEALKKLYPNKVRVPQPIDWNRHIVVTEYIEGVELFKASYLNDPHNVIEDILENVLKAWKAGVVHGDLSEYNILISEDEKPILFDWPQWIPSTHPMASYYLKRDMVTILKFFKRKYHLKINTEEEAGKLLLEWGVS